MKQFNPQPHPDTSAPGKANRLALISERLVELRAYLAAGRRRQMLETAIELNRQTAELLTDCYDLLNRSPETL